MPSTWYSGGLSGAQAAGTVIVDSGQLSHELGTVAVVGVFNADVAAQFTIAHRNAANTADLSSQDITLLASSPFTFGPFNMSPLDNERVRIVLKSALLAGNVFVSLFFT